MEKDIINFCGEYPSNYKPIDIGNSPDFIFKNDAEYSSKYLYDSDGNSVIVNSFVECEHYVSGGWNYNLIPNENVTYFRSSILLISILLMHLIYKKLQKYRNE